MFPRRVVIRHHLVAIGEPLVSEELLQAAELAVDLANAGAFRAEVTMPDGTALSALECVDRLRLDPFVHGLEP